MRFAISVAVPCHACAPCDCDALTQTPEIGAVTVAFVSDMAYEAPSLIAHRLLRQ